jgi:hypothetical protein
MYRYGRKCNLLCKLKEVIMNGEEAARLEFDKEESRKRVRQRCLELSISNNGLSVNNLSESASETDKILIMAKKFADFVNGDE